MRISKFSYRDFAAWGRRCSLSCTSSSQETPSTSQQTHSVNNRTASYNLYLYNTAGAATGTIHPETSALHRMCTLAVHWGWLDTVPGFPRRRCCTNRPWPARCPPTGSSPADAIRHWSAEGGHPIEDLTAEDDLTPLPSWTPGAKAISDDGLVAEERVLHPALTMVP